MELRGADQATGSVLVVDDDEGTRQELRFLLEPRFRVFAAGNGERAIEIVRHENLDVVTLDLELPGLSGVETLARIRNLEPEVEVVVVTGAGSHEQEAEALRLRAFDYITKPFDGGHLLDVLERAERNRQNLLRALASAEDPHFVAGEISERLGMMYCCSRSMLAENDRLKVDYARLLANAVRDRIDLDARPRIEALVQAVEELGSAISPSSFQGRAAFGALETLARCLRRHNRGQARSSLS